MNASPPPPSPLKRLLFFSGGTALRSTAQALVRNGHDSIHLITPFDSGGSSAAIRKGFAMPAVGDIRNRLMALADPLGDPAISALFAHRLPKDADRAGLRLELDKLANGKHPLARLPDSARGTILDLLRLFRERMPEDFDLRGASVGNLVLTAGYLTSGRRLAPAIDIFSELVRAHGTVRPTVDQDLHLAVRLDNGHVVTGQHNITGKEAAPLTSPIRDIWLTPAPNDATPVHAAISDEINRNIAEADLICYPMGSFYSSIVANLLPDGVGRAVAANNCPKIFVPGTGPDPEIPGLNVAQQAVLLGRYLEASGAPSESNVLDAILLDTKNGHYPGGVDTKKIKNLGIEILDRPLVTEASTPALDGERLSTILLSLA